jgi:hypothetical protein
MLRRWSIRRATRGAAGQPEGNILAGRGSGEGTDRGEARAERGTRVWLFTETAPDGKSVKVKTERFGTSLRYRARYVGRDGTEKSKSFREP